VATDRTIPNLENATPTYLIDEIARMRVEAARLKFLDGIYKQALEARITDEQKSGEVSIEGLSSLGNYRVQTQERIDSDAVKEYFKDKPEELKKVMKVIEFKVLSTVPKVTEV
jgi:hypothetical protein